MKINSDKGLALLSYEGPPFPGGIATFVHEISQSVSMADHYCKLICPAYAGQSLPHQYELSGILKHHKLRIRDFGAILKELRDLPPSIYILGADVRSVMILYATQALHRRKYTAMVHGSEALKLSRSGPIFGLARKSYRSAERVFFNSRATREIFEHSAGPMVSSFVSHLGVDRGWFSAPQQRISQWISDLDNGSAIFCSVGRIEPRKGQLETVRALSEVARKLGQRQVVYVIPGYVEDPGYLAEVINAGRSGNVTVIAPGRIETDDLKALYSLSVAHCLLAQPIRGRIEGFGLVLLESAAQGCPSIATNVGGISEAVSNRRLLCDPFEMSAASELMVSLALDPNLRSTYGVEAQIFAASFTWERCVNTMFPELATS